MKPISVLIAEDHTVVREGLRALLDADEGIKVTGEARNGRQAVELATEHQPSVVLMDIAMPDLNGFEATRQILQAFPATRVLILSAHDDDAYVDQALAMGAVGYLIKQSTGKTLTAAIREVAKGKTYLSPTIAKRLRNRQHKTPDHSGVMRKKIVKLSPRETEVLQLVAEGGANKQIAATLGISVKTVEKHRQHLMDKLDIHDTASLTRYAMGAGIIEGCVQIDPH